MSTKQANIVPEGIKELINIVSELRSPIGGCPWDLKQTHYSLIPFLLEEAHEVADAIRHGNDNNLKEELGDLLLQIVLHAQIAEEEKRFCLEDIAKSINKKIIRRHPHVFKKKERKTIEEVKKNWESIKKMENPSSLSKSPLSDELKRKVRSQSAIAGAVEISKKAAKAGFEWDSVKGVWDKVDEELKELKEALTKKDFLNAQAELGDTIFTLINIARWFNLSPEEGLDGTNQRFLARFSYVESAIEGNFSNQNSNDLKKLWQAAKKEVERTKKIDTLF